MASLVKYFIIKELKCLYEISNNNEALLFELGKSFFFLNDSDNVDNNTVFPDPRMPDSIYIFVDGVSDVNVLIIFSVWVVLEMYSVGSIPKVIVNGLDIEILLLVSSDPGIRIHFSYNF